MDSKGPVRFFTGDSGGSHLGELTHCEEPHVCVLSATPVLPRLLPLRISQRKSGEREQVVKPNWVDFPTSVNQKGRASANSCASDHLLPQYHNEWGPNPRGIFCGCGGKRLRRYLPQSLSILLFKTVSP